MIRTTHFEEYETFVLFHDLSMCGILQGILALFCFPVCYAYKIDSYKVHLIKLPIVSHFSSSQLEREFELV